MNLMTNIMLDKVTADKRKKWSRKRIEKAELKESEKIGRRTNACLTEAARKKLELDQSEAHTWKAS